MKEDIFHGRIASCSLEGGKSDPGVASDWLAHGLTCVIHGRFTHATVAQ
ncbi:MAG: hypothetical protein Q4G62_11940 [Pseudomonadota bacterium]|nr:hypothetical protein [Pseudomonadota bacterium]